MGEGVFKQENSSSNSDEQALDESNGERPAHERVELLIDELRKRTAELEAANRELRRVSHYRSLFLARMSHELRTPLTSILGFSEILEEICSGKYSVFERLTITGLPKERPLGRGLLSLLLISRCYGLLMR